MKCPVCKRSTGFFKWPATDPAHQDDILPYPLLQRSYPGQPEHISGRCNNCYDKAIKKEAKRENRKNPGKTFQKTVLPVPPGTYPTTPAICRSCFLPLGRGEGLTDNERFTELVMRVCIKCLNEVNTGVEKLLNREPDYANAFLINTGAAELDCPQARAIPMKERAATPSFWNKILRR